LQKNIPDHFSSTAGHRGNHHNDTDPLHKRTGELLDFVWSWHSCTGEYVYEHLNKSTNQYEVVQKGSHHFQIRAIELDDAGSYRCWKRCNDTEQSPYCYFAVNGNKNYFMSHLRTFIFL